jgi:hypothetical protein
LAWYYGPSNDIKKTFLYGPTVDVDGGYLVGGTIFIGLNNNGDVVWIGAGSGLGGTLGGSVGIGNTSSGLNNDPNF